MGIVLKAHWGHKKAETRGDLIQQLINGSEMFVSVSLGSEHPKLIYIELHGILAQIPSLKNSSHQFGGISIRELSAIKAMDRMFIESVKQQGFTQKQLSFGNQMIHIALIVGSGARATSNEDNAMTTIKDWVEVPTKIVGGKKKGFRGWGIGLIKDDIQARGYPLKHSDIGVNQTCTSISIRPWTDVQTDAVNFMAQCRQLSEASC